jgi:hypothetical protein
VVRYVSNDSLEKKILTEGKKVKAKIISCKRSDDPEDDEHTIYEIDFEYRIDGIKINKNFNFSINTTHIAYAHEGGLLGVPKLDISLDDFEKLLSPGEAFDVVSLATPPYEYVFYFSEKLDEVMKYKQVWM